MADILDQLKNRTLRPKVPDREDPLLSEISHQNKEISIENQSSSKENKDSVRDNSYGSDLRRFTLRIDAPIGIEIDSICSSQKITPETLLESFLMIYGNNDEAMQIIIEEAKLRYQKRKLIGVKRRIKAMNEKYSDEES